jgi:hypothetical protein
MFTCLLLAGLLAFDDDAIEAPVVGRPDNFSGAIGAFRIQARVEPATTQVEKPISLTLTITASGVVGAAPEAPALDQVPGVRDNFHLEAAESPAASERSWQFVYRLKPKRLAVREVPGIPFVFFNPAVARDARGYQTVYTDAIPIEVKPADEVASEPSDRTPAVSHPDVVLTLAQGDAVLSRQTPWTLPAFPILLLLALAPPALCAAWYVVWRRLNPDAARQTERRRSRAARQALRGIPALRRLTDEALAKQAALLVTAYLCDRLGFLYRELSPREAATKVEQAIGDPELAARLQTFLEDCDSCRYFLPASDHDRAAETEQLILALEAATWPEPAV